MKYCIKVGLSCEQTVYMHTHIIFISDIKTINVKNVILLMKNSCTGWDDIPANITKIYMLLLLFATTRSVFKSVKVSVVEIAKRTN